MPVVIADLSRVAEIEPSHLESIGYSYDEGSDKWTIADSAADYVFTGNQVIRFALPGTLRVIVYPATWEDGLLKFAEIGEAALKEFREKYFPIYQDSGYAQAKAKSDRLNFVMIDCYSGEEIPSLDATDPAEIEFSDPTVVLCLSSTHSHAMPAVRRKFIELMNRGVRNPVILIVDSYWQTPDEHLIHFATETGALLLDGLGDGICLGMTAKSYELLAASCEPMSADRQPTAEEFAEANSPFTIHHSPPSVNGGLSSVILSGRNYLQHRSTEQFINNTAFSILQATRTRISKTEYISCPSCGRTLFDLQETTARIRAVTNHLKGVKIAIMGCIVNGPGEMADADFGYVGSGPGKITLYRGKEVVKRSVNSEVAVEELILLLKESGAWVEPVTVNRESSIVNS